MQSYEVEVKSLLGTPEHAAAVRAAMKMLDPDCSMIAHNRQLNHYFEPKDRADTGALERLAGTMGQHLPEDSLARLRDLAARADTFSVRTRDKDNIVLLVVKASVGADSSANGVSRMEFEAQVPLTIVELDDLVRASGFEYQAKWSREREEFVCKGVNVCIDRNAGYGYIAEFERVVDDPSGLAAAEAQVRSLMRELGVEELPQDRLERMFAFYNAHWPEYYGTERIFVVE